jgi:hypothetical protein
MILEIEGKRVQVDDSFSKLDPQQQEAQVAEIAKSLAPAQKEQPSGGEQINPLLPMLGGAAAAEFLGPSINKSSEAFMETKKLIKSGWDPKVASDFVRGKFGAVENWGRQMHGGEFFGGRDMPEAYRQGMQAKYPGGIPANPVPGGPMSPSAPIPSGPTPGAIPPGAAKAAPAGMAGRAAASPTLQSMRSALGAGLSGTVPAVIGRGIAGGSAAFQGVDAYNRAQSGDYGGALIGGLGAIGSAASLIPHPITRIGGTALGMGAEALNMYLDSLKNKNKPQGMREGGRALSPEVSFDAKSIPSMSGMPGVGYMQSPQGTMARMQMSQPIGDGHLRAGVSGMGMAIPGQHGVKLMPGQMDVGYSIPVGPGHLDISGQRNINKPMPGKQQPYRANVNYSIPFAQGGLAYIK